VHCTSYLIMAAEMDWTELRGSGTLHSGVVKIVIELRVLLLSFAFCFKNGKASDIIWTFDLTLSSRDSSKSGKSQFEMLWIAGF